MGAGSLEDGEVGSTGVGTLVAGLDGGRFAGDVLSLEVGFVYEAAGGGGPVSVVAVAGPGTVDWVGRSVASLAGLYTCPSCCDDDNGMHHQ